MQAFSCHLYAGATDNQGRELSAETFDDMVGQIIAVRAQRPIDKAAVPNDPQLQAVDAKDGPAIGLPWRDGATRRCNEGTAPAAWTRLDIDEGLNSRADLNAALDFLKGLSACVWHTHSSKMPARDKRTHERTYDDNGKPVYNGWKLRALIELDRVPETPADWVATTQAVNDALAQAVPSVRAAGGADKTASTIAQMQYTPPRGRPVMRFNGKPFHVIKAPPPAVVDPFDAVSLPSGSLETSAADRAILGALTARGAIRGRGPKPGSWRVVCPRESFHSSRSESDSDCLFYESDAGRPWAFHCLHDHCQGVPQQAFTDALGLSFEEVSTRDTMRRNRAEARSSYRSASSGVPGVPQWLDDVPPAELPPEAQQRPPRPEMTPEQYRAATNARAALDGLLDIPLHPEDYKPISSGIKAVDDALYGGFYRGCFAVLGGATSSGKTSLTVQMVDAFLDQGYSVLYVSLEMTRAELLMRSVSRLMTEGLKPDIETVGTPGIDLKQQASFKGAAKFGELLDPWKRSKLDWSTIARANKTAADRTAYERLTVWCPWERNENAPELSPANGQRITAADLIRAVDLYRRMKPGRAPIVVVDYLQLMGGNDRQDDLRATDENVIALKALANNEDTLVLTLSSFNRASAKQSMVDEAGFKNSGLIEYQADIVLGMAAIGADHEGTDGKTNTEINAKYRKAKGEDPRTIDVQVLKNRRGRVNESALLEYYPAYSAFRAASPDKVLAATAQRAAKEEEANKAAAARRTARNNQMRLSTLQRDLEIYEAQKESLEALKASNIKAGMTAENAAVDRSISTAVRSILKIKAEIAQLTKA